MTACTELTKEYLKLENKSLKAFAETTIATYFSRTWKHEMVESHDNNTYCTNKK